MSSILNSIWGAASYVLPACLARQSNGEMMRKRFGNNAEAQSVYKEYFSCYSKDLLPLDNTILDQIGRIVERKAVGLEIGHHWRRVLFGDGLALDNTHREVVNEGLLQQALKAQFTFDRELIKLKKLDGYQRLTLDKVVPELGLLKRTASPWLRFWGQCTRYSEPERTLINGLRKKAELSGRTLKEQAKQSVRMREGLLQELQAKIGVIRAERFTPQEEALLDPRSNEIRELLADSRRAEPSEVYDAPSLHPSLKDHCVVALGDPIKDPDADFMIVKRPARMPEEVWLKLISAENTFVFSDLLKQSGIKPNETFLAEYIDSGNTYRVELSYEKVSETLGLHENRDFGMKTRREVVEPGKFKRTNATQSRGVVSFVKDVWRTVVSGNWSEHREATAGPDCHEAITVNRNMIDKILSGRMSDIPQRVSQNLGEYFNSLPVSDVAKLNGSYMEDPNFVQAVRVQQQIYQSQKQLYQEGMMIPYLEQGIKGEFDWKKNGPRIDILTQNVFDIFSAWSQNLNLFLQELRKPENRKTAAAFGPGTVAELGRFLTALQTFMRDAPIAAIAPVLDQRRLIIQAHAGQMNPVAIQQLDQVWSNWKQNKTPEEIDQVLSDVCGSIDLALGVFSPNLINISVPFSSAQTQTDIGETMAGKPELYGLYTKAIPPIWQNKARLQLIKDELLKGTELSPLWLKEAEMLSNGDARLLENEFERSRLAKLYIGANAP